MKIFLTLDYSWGYERKKLQFKFAKVNRIRNYNKNTVATNTELIL